MKDEKEQYLIFDAHLDLGMNAMEWNRDLTWEIEAMRSAEANMTDKPDRGKNTVSFPEMRKSNIGLCVGTQIARYVKPSNSLPGWRSPEQAWAMTQAQLAWYKEMEKAGELNQITNSAQLQQHLDDWTSGNTTSIGYMLSLEGADSIVTLDHVDIAYEYGLRAIGPAHYGPGTYAQGTDAKGGIGIKGRDLLKKMESLNIILDATHLCDDSFWEAMENFNGAVWASHSNCRTFVNHNRQFSDDQLRLLIDRGAVIGAPLDAWMMVEGWKRGVSNAKEANVSLELMVKNIDHICQMAGNSQHAAIGSDLDGAFGSEQTPYDLDKISDLQKVPDILKNWGYSDSDIKNIMHQNWIRFLFNTWG